MIRLFRRTLIALFLLILLLAGAMLLSITTNKGSQQLWSIAQSLVGEQVELGEINGPLSGPFTVSDFELKNNEMSVAVTQIEVEWSLNQLFDRTLRIDSLNVKGIDYQILKSAPESKTDQPPFDISSLSLPVAIEAETVTVSDFRFLSAPQSAPLILDELSFGLALSNEEISLQTAKLESPQGTLDANMSIQLSDLETAGSLSWDVAIPESPAIQGNAKLSGEINNLNVLWNAQAPYQMSGHANVRNLMDQLTADVVIREIDITLSAIRETLPDTRVQGLIKAQTDVQSNKTTFQSALAVTNAPEVGDAKTALSGAFENNTITIDQWRISPDNLDTQVDATGKISLSDSKELTLVVDWQDLQWPLNAEPVLISPSGRTTVSGNLSNPVISIGTSVIRPLMADLVQGDVRLDLTTAKPTVNGQLSIPKLRYPHADEAMIDRATVNLAVKGQMPLLTVSLELSQQQADQEGSQESAMPRALTTNAEVDLSTPAQPRMNVTGDWQNLQWPMSTSAAEEVKVRSQKGEFSFSGTPSDIKGKLQANINDGGEIKVRLGYSPSKIDVEADWENLGYQNAEQLLQSKSGKLTVQGIPDDYTLMIDSFAEIDDKSLRVLANGSGTLSSLQLKELSAELLDGEITGPANIDWSNGVVADMNIVAKRINPGKWFPEWPGQIDGSIKGATRIIESTVEIDDLQVALEGELREYPVNASLKAEKTAEKILIDSVTLQSAETIFKADGYYADTIDLNWELDSSDLRSVHPQASGSVTATGRLQGSVESPVINAQLSGDSIQFAENILKKVVASIAVDSTDQTASNIDINLNGQLGEIEVTSAAINASGLLKKHQIELTAETSKGSVDANLESRLKTFSEWEFDLNQATLDIMDFGQWNLAKPASGNYDAPSFSLTTACFENSSSTICADGKRTEEGLESSFEITDLVIADLISPFQGNFIVDGAISGKGNIVKSGDADPVGTIELTTTKGELRSKFDDTDESDTQLLVFDAGKLALQLDQGRTTASFDLPLAGNDLLSAKATLSGQSANWAKRNLAAEITASIANIEFLQHLAPGTANVSGSLQGDMKISGSIERPTLQGSLALQKGKVDISAAEITLEDINISLDGNPQSGMDLSGNMRSGGGNLSLSGEVDLSKGAPVADILLAGENAQVMNTALAEVYISPDLRLRVNDKDIELTGDLAIPEANITVQSIPRSAIKPSSDQIIVTEEKNETVNASPIQLSANVTTRLGSAVNFSGFGLTGKLGGAVTSIETPGKPSQIEGEIKVSEGRYQAYGQNLTIETGRLLFAGAGATNPALDLRASRQPTEEVKVGVTARGKLQQPEFTLYSTPSMTDRNKLSYLILGRAADQTSDGEKSQLGQLALALGLKRSEGITNTIGDTLGIDQIGVETEPGTDAEQESFVIGKYLTPKLYLRYGIGLFEPINTLRLQYSINEHWKIVSESSDKASSGDIQYSIDR